MVLNFHEIYFILLLAGWKAKKNKNQPTFLVKNNTIYFFFLNETFKTITKCFRTHAIFLHAGCTKDVLLSLRFLLLLKI